MNARRYVLPRMGVGVWVLAVILVAGQAWAGPPKSRSRGQSGRAQAAPTKSSHSRPQMVSRSGHTSSGSKATARPTGGRSVRNIGRESGGSGGSKATARPTGGRSVRNFGHKGSSGGGQSGSRLTSRSGGSAKAGPRIRYTRPGNGAGSESGRHGASSGSTAPSFTRHQPGSGGGRPTIQPPRRSPLTVTRPDTSSTFGSRGPTVQPVRRATPTVSPRPAGGSRSQYYQPSRRPDRPSYTPQPDYSYPRRPASYGTRRHHSGARCDGRRTFGRSDYRTGYVRRYGRRTTCGTGHSLHRSSHRWYRNYCNPSSTTVVWPQSFYEDRYVEPIYLTDPFVEQVVVGQPVIETTSSPDYWGLEGAALLPPAATAPQSELTAPMAAGDEAFRAGDYDEARRHYIRAQLDGPYAGEATLAYALVHFAEGNYQLSALALRRGLEAVPDAVLEPIDVAWLYGDTEALERHLGSLETYLSEWPTDRAGWFLLGYVRFGAGHPARAAEAFERAAALAPGEALYQLLLEAAQTVMSMPPPGGGGDLSLAPPGAGTPLYATWPEIPG